MTGLRQCDRAHW